MNNLTLQQQCKPFRGAVLLEKYIGRKALRALQIAGVLLVVAGGAGVLFTVTAPNIFISFSLSEYFFYGLLLLGSGVWLDASLGRWYHNSFYYRGLANNTPNATPHGPGVTYDLATAVLQHPQDATRGFATSSLGSHSLLRCGITTAAITDFLNNHRTAISTKTIPTTDETHSLIGLGKYILQHDTAFAEFLQSNVVTPDTFRSALRWVVGEHHQNKQAAAWWHRDNLSKIGGIGTELSYGTAYTLQKFSRSPQTSAVFSTLTNNPLVAQGTVAEMETILTKQKAANILLLGEAGVGKIDLVVELSRRMRSGEAHNALRGSHVYILDNTKLLAVCTEKHILEQTLLHLLSEAANASDVIIVIENISTLIQEAEVLEVHLPELFDQFLAHPSIQFICTDTPQNFHQTLQQNKEFTRRFSEVLLDTPTTQATIQVLQPIAKTQEKRLPIFWIHQAVQAVAIAADRHITTGVLPDKAIALLLEVGSAAAQQSQSVITADMVYQTVSDKTGIPTGPVSTSESDKLIHLQDELHHLVIGQEAALSAIARTIRRARAGIQSTERPIGTFLFLGPTGVGKTETAKALAEVFFEGEHNLQRLDMSEYNGAGAVAHLLGDSSNAGTLPTILRDHPYCVLLLDEFEKASSAVHDIFLQVFDEGLFTDGRGEQVNARNCIIIATSNAGSKLITETISHREQVPHLNDDIIDHIIKTGVYRPELLNRFDSTVIFEPLTKPEQVQVARLMLQDVHKRLEEKGYRLSISEPVISELVEHGYHPEFGARPLRRIIQDVIEEAISQKILTREAQPGDTVQLGMSDVIFPTV